MMATCTACGIDPAEVGLSDTSLRNGLCQRHYRLAARYDDDDIARCVDCGRRIPRIMRKNWRCVSCNVKYIERGNGRKPRLLPKMRRVEPQYPRVVICTRCNGLCWPDGSLPDMMIMGCIACGEQYYFTATYAEVV